jgi:hypothetical protein
MLQPTTDGRRLETTMNNKTSRSRLLSGVLALAFCVGGAAQAGHFGGGGGGFHGGGFGGGSRGAVSHAAGGYRGGFAGRGGYRGYGGYGGYRGYRGYGGYGGWAALDYGLFFAALPLGYATYWWGGIPYYYANDNYYTWNGTASEYETVAPPAGLAQSASSENEPAELIAYPKSNQSPEQQARDLRECRSWAASQVAARAGATVNHSDYLRAEDACLSGRGYSVR